MRLFISDEMDLLKIGRRVAAALALCAACAVGARADRYTDYVEQYAPLAVECQQSDGIPASITLAQGLLESAAGRSRLAVEGNNHFGIKCHSTWQGPTMLRDDDAPDECFRVYASAAESYADHARFLRGRRYQPLFALPAGDYRAWARTLRECGYATDPNYADRLVSIIERYALYQYDTGATDPGAADFIMQELSRVHAVRTSRGLHYVIANPGDTYAAIAAEFSVDAARLAALNDASSPSDVIKDWEEVYFQEKMETAPKGVKRVTIGEGESLHSVAQRYGMKVAAVRALNPGAPDREGTRLRLSR